MQSPSDSKPTKQRFGIRYPYPHRLGKRFRKP